MHNDYLAHHGIKGQRWGIRRFQNSDGSYTEAGRKRYAKELKKKVNKSANNYLNNVFKVGKTMADAINKPNTSRVRESLYNDPDYVKANDRFSKAQLDHMHSVEEAVRAYGPDVARWPDKTVKRLESSLDNVNALSKKHWEQFEKTLNKYEPQLLSAALKDIGEADTEVGRQIIKEIYQGRHGDQWWLT